MIEINLIPVKLKKAKQLQMAIVGVGLGASVVVAAAVGIVLYRISETGKIDAQIKRIDAESASLQDKIEEVRQFNGKKEIYKKKKAIVNKLVADQSLWAELLDRIGEMVLSDMWLTNLSQDRIKDEGIMIKISGESLSKVVVAEFIKRLENSPYVLNLITAQVGETAKKDEGITAVTFEVSFVYKTGQAQAQAQAGTGGK
jgi:Tfp pilus assembly protein PilN